MAGRPPSGFRLGTGAGGRAPLGTAMGRPPGTGMNLPTTARPGTRGGMGAGGALNSMVQISDRPVTRQGLGGIKTQGQGPQRQVMDKSYFLGVMRQKMNELNTEIGKLTKEINHFNQENASFISYEKRAENLANEIKTLQGELADYNAIVDKLNINAGFEDLKEDYDWLKSQNDKEAKTIDKLFAQKQDKENILKQLEIELEQERSKTQSIVADMSTAEKQKYSELMKKSLQLQQDLETKQQNLDDFNQKVDILEEEVSQSPVKQEAVSLYEKISELEEKRASLIDEMKKKESPAEERERLLRQVKEDNQEIARMEKRANEIREKTEKLQDEVGNLDMDLEEHHGERTAKYKELKKREVDMQEFLDTFDATMGSSGEKKSDLEANIVSLLEKISRATVQTKHMPSSKDFKQMQADLNFKETEMNKSKDTSSGLDSEHSRLQNDLEKVDQLETKITEELNSLKEKISKMTEELGTYSDLSTLKRNSEEKKNYLLEEKKQLQDAKVRLKNDVQNKSSEYSSTKKKLDENETYSQLGNLERKWQHIEQNNFAMKEFNNKYGGAVIAQKSVETNYSVHKENVGTWVVQINQKIIEALKGANATKY